jgi:transposase
VPQASLDLPQFGDGSLAKLLYLGEAPTVHVPSLDVRTWRELINCRTQVIAKRTRAKNTLRALLRGAAVVPPKSPGLWTKNGLAWLRQLELPTSSQQLRRDLLLEEVEGLNRQVRRIEQELNRRAQQTPAVARLRTIPGVGLRTAEAVAAFLDDPQRFRHAKAVGRYFGLVLCQDQSGDRNRLGHITREGPAVVRRLAGGAALADGPGVLRADPARRPAAEEDRGGGDGALPGARDVGAAEARGRLAGERGPGPVAPARTRREGPTKRGESPGT